MPPATPPPNHKLKHLNWACIFQLEKVYAAFCPQAIRDIVELRLMLDASLDALRSATTFLQQIPGL